jgi:hypothetical protein
MNQPTTPNAARSAALTATGLFAFLALQQLALVPSAPATDGWVSWWEAAGTDRAVMEALRLAGLGISLWLIAISVLAIMAAVTDSRRLCRTWARVTPAALRPMLAVSAATGLAASCASGAGANEPLGERPVDPTPATLADIDPVDEAGIEPVLFLADVGSSPATERPKIAAAAGVWTVEADDHLWSIAEETLADGGVATGEAAVTRYWNRLIAENREAFGADEDLVHPGLVLILPA